MEPRLATRTWLSCAVPAGLLLWRLACRPVGGFWRDAVILLSAYWIFTVLAGTSRHWPRVTVTLLSFLLGIYVSGQLPHTLRLLGALP